MTERETSRASLEQMTVSPAKLPRGSPVSADAGAQARRSRSGEGNAESVKRLWPMRGLRHQQSAPLTEEELEIERQRRLIYLEVMGRYPVE